MITINNKVLKINGDWLKSATAPQIVYNVILNQTTGGTISAQPMNGVNGTTVTLSNTPATNYTFNGYSISGSTLYDSNKFDISGSDVTCSANWYHLSEDEVAIGNQIWMKDCVNIDDGGSGIYSNGSGQYLYTFEAALRIANSISGYHMPTAAEWETLLTYCSTGVDGYQYLNAGLALKSTTGWKNNGNGNDTYGFNIEPHGAYYGGSIVGVGANSYFWGGTNNQDAVNMYVSWDITYAFFGPIQPTQTPYQGQCLRLIKD